MQIFDRSAAVGFGINPLDRLSERRGDAAFIEAERRDPATRFLVFVGDVPLLNRQGEGYDALFTQEQAAACGTPAQEVFLGQDYKRQSLFAMALPPSRAQALATRPGLELIDLRSIATRGLFEPDLLGEMGAAKSVLGWQQRHGFCAQCGAASRPASAGWRRDCPACGAQHFPRVDPVVIMLVVDGDRCLLGRQARFAPGMYSALAGFLEPGETVEDAVRREVREEAGIICSRVAYFASQPWPFPAQLMVGCYAQAQTTEVVVDRNELEDARWFTRDELAAMFAGTHPQGFKPPMHFAIAHHLLKAFVEEGQGLL